jgi:hypothetical protein
VLLLFACLGLYSIMVWALGIQEGWFGMVTRLGHGRYGLLH